MEEILVEFEKRFPCRFNTSLAARAALFNQLRHMSDEDYLAGRAVLVKCLYREGIEIRPRLAEYRIGGKPRPDRSWETMHEEIEAAIAKTGSGRAR